MEKAKRYTKIEELKKFMSYLEVIARQLDRIAIIRSKYKQVDLSVSRQLSEEYGSSVEALYIILTPRLRNPEAAKYLELGYKWINLACSLEITLTEIKEVKERLRYKSGEERKKLEEELKELEERKKKIISKEDELAELLPAPYNALIKRYLFRDQFYAPSRFFFDAALDAILKYLDEKGVLIPSKVIELGV